MEIPPFRKAGASALVMPESVNPESLRVVHVIAHVSPDGRYGGPLRVASDLARAQRIDGHETRLVATHEGYANRPLAYASVPLMSYRARRISRRGFAGLFSPTLLAHVLRSRSRTDVFHIHLARDALTAVVALALSLTKSRYVLQTHGMIEPRANRLVRLYDRFVLRPAARRAFKVLVLTPAEARLFAALGVERSRLHVQANGVELGDLIHEQRRQILFLARLHPRKGGRDFAEAAVRLASRWPNLTFAIAGPDEGDLPEISSTIARAGFPFNVQVLGAIEPLAVPAAMARSVVYVLPAANEPFGLTILEALAQNTPVVVHRSAALADVIREHEAGTTFRGGIDGLVETLGHLLLNRERCTQLGLRGRALAERYAIAGVARSVTKQYGFTTTQEQTAR